MGVISMKLVGEGHFTQREDRQAAMKFAFRNAGVDAVTVGYKNTAEIDEAIENLNLALAVAPASSMIEITPVGCGAVSRLSAASPIQQSLDAPRFRSSLCPGPGVARGGIQNCWSLRRKIDPGGNLVGRLPATGTQLRCSGRRVAFRYGARGRPLRWRPGHCLRHLKLRSRSGSSRSRSCIPSKSWIFWLKSPVISDFRVSAAGAGRGS